MLVCSACGSECVAKAVLVDVNDGSLIEEISAVPHCFDCNDACELVNESVYRARERQERYFSEEERGQ